MALSDDQQRLVDEVGETDDGRLAANVGALLAMWAEKDLLKVGLARLYAKRQLIDLALGTVRGQVDFAAAGDVGMKSSQRAAALQTMYDKTMAEIVRLERKARARRRSASLALTTTSPASPPLPPPYPDSNAKRIRGDPYERPLYGRDSGLP